MDFYMCFIVESSPLVKVPFLFATTLVAHSQLLPSLRVECESKTDSYVPYLVDSFWSVFSKITTGNQSSSIKASSILFSELWFFKL